MNKKLTNKKLMLIGNPNVGKSAIFSRLTGVKVIVSNYHGTTVEYTKGYLKLGDDRMEIVDIPGIYSLEPTMKAEEIAVKIFEEAVKEKNENIFINVIDSTNLERNLNLTYELIKRNIPLIIVLNFWDEAGHTGVSINREKLENILGVPVITTCGITGEGIKNLVDNLHNAGGSDFLSKDSTKDTTEKNKWERIGEIIEQVQKLKHRHHTIGEKLSDFSIHPLSGLLVAIIVLGLSFSIIRLIGESLITYLLEPMFENYWTPVLLKMSALFNGNGILHDILIGQVIDGKISYLDSMGMLSTGLFVPIAMILPYITAFYFVLSFLEDSGYLPRLGILVDNLMHKLGIHGLAIIPMLLGIGCNVPGALSTRMLETRREKFIASTLMAIAVPCMAQIAMIFGLLGRYGLKAIIIVFGILFVVWVVLGLLINRFVKGTSPEIFTEIPPYRIPYFKSLLKKLWMRVIWFVKEAVPYVLLGVLIINILYVLHVIDFLGNLVGPIITGLMGLPKETVGALIVGFLRKDVAVGMLVPLGLSMKQMIISSVILTMYFPCIATFTVLLKELGAKDMAKSATIMILSTLIVGTILNLVL
ncbi:MAG: ferrous iron transporter B [Candidatus Marinimicrobia bacterium]|nr:ferrous iron transporter B [Candidatus Neomarinimicrobiota bacterium]